MTKPCDLIWVIRVHHPFTRAAPPGFEPRRTDSESVMLAELHHGAMRPLFDFINPIPRQGSLTSVGSSHDALALDRSVNVDE